MATVRCVVGYPKAGVRNERLRVGGAAVYQDETGNSTSTRIPSQTQCRACCDNVQRQAYDGRRSQRGIAMPSQAAPLADQRRGVIQQRDHGTNTLSTCQV